MTTFLQFCTITTIMTAHKLFTISVPTSIGRFQLVASSLGLRAVHWPSQPFPLEPQASGLKPPGFLKTTARQLADYLAGQRAHFTAPLDLSPLSPFARSVLRALSRIPHGQSITYSQLAKRIGKPAATRAVGGVLARNPLPIIIPCHRVISSDGSLGGFSAPGGVTLKRRLLTLEGISLTG